MWKTVKSFLTNNIRFGDYTLNLPDDASVTTIQAPVLIDGEYVGGIYHEARTGALFPFEDYIASIPDKDQVMSSATFNFQITMRLSGANDYENLEDAIVTAMDMANDVLLVIDRNYEAISPAVKYSETLECNPVGIARAKQAEGSRTPADWLIIVSPKFKLHWLPDFSDDVNTDYYIPPSVIEVGIFLAENQDLTERVLDETVRIDIN